MEGLSSSETSQLIHQKLEQNVQERFAAPLSGIAAVRNQMMINVINKRFNSEKLSEEQQSDYAELKELMAHVDTLSSEDRQRLQDLTKKMMIRIMSQKKGGSSKEGSNAKIDKSTSSQVLLRVPDLVIQDTIQLFFDWKYVYSTLDELEKLSEDEKKVALALFELHSKKISKCIYDLENSHEEHPFAKSCLFLMIQGRSNMLRLALMLKDPRIALFDITEEIEKEIEYSWKLSKEKEEEIREKLKILREVFEGDDKDHCDAIQIQLANIYEFSMIFADKLERLKKEKVRQDVIDVLTDRFQNFSKLYLHILHCRYGVSFELPPTEQDKADLVDLLEEIESFEDSFVEFTE